MITYPDYGPYISPVPGGRAFVYDGRTDYAAEEGIRVPPVEVEAAVADLSSRFPLDWLDCAIFCLPWVLRFNVAGYGWAADYQAQAHPRHIVIGAHHAWTAVNVPGLVSHELGHLVSFAVFGGQPDAWDGNQNWTEYLSVRPELAGFSRRGIVWEDRVQEIVAEDFRFSFGSVQALVSPFTAYEDGNPPPPSKQVKEWWLSKVPGQTEARVVRVPIRLTIGSPEIIVGDKVQVMDVAPFIASNRTFVPIRFIAEAMGYKVEWDAKAKTVTLRP